jgi:hypothetical protein
MMKTISKLLVLAALVGVVSAASAQVDGVFAKVTSKSLNGVVYADNYPGSDIGAQINNAVQACVTAGVVCNIQVAAGGTISTPPELPIGFSLSFNPLAQYTLSTPWVMDHRGVTYNFNGAQFTYSLSDASTAFYIGKNDSYMVNVSGTTVTLTAAEIAAGANFNNIDPGDQVQIDGGAGSGIGNPLGGNVDAVTSTSLTISAAVSGSPLTNVRMSVFLESSTARNSFPGRNVVIKDLTVTGTSNSSAMAVELADNVAVYNYTANLFSGGFCLKLLGAITGNFYNTHCNGDGFGVDLDQNVAGGFWVSTSNANRFFGLDLVDSPMVSGVAVLFNAGGGNALYAVHAEGEANSTVALFQSVSATGYGGTINPSNNLLQVADFERNGTNTAGDKEIGVGNGSGEVIEGGSFASVYTGSGGGAGTQFGIIIASGAVDTTIRDTSFIDNYATSYNFQGGSTGFVENVNSIGEIGPPANAWTLAGFSSPAINTSSSSTLVLKAAPSASVSVAAFTFSSSAVTFDTQTFTIPTVPSGSMVVCTPQSDFGSEVQFTCWASGTTLNVKLTHGPENLPFTSNAVTLNYEIIQ